MIARYILSLDTKLVLSYNQHVGLINALQLMSGLAVSKNSGISSSFANKPKPYKWLVNRHGIVEVFDFNYWKRSDPPPIDHDCQIVPFFKGYYTNTGAWVTE